MRDKIRKDVKKKNHFHLKKQLEINNKRTKIVLPFSIKGRGWSCQLLVLKPPIFLDRYAYFFLKKENYLFHLLLLLEFTNLFHFKHATVHENMCPFKYSTLKIFPQKKYMLCMLKLKYLVGYCVRIRVIIQYRKILQRLCMVAL